MEQIEDKEENVQLMGIEEELKHPAPYAGERGRPHEQPREESYFSCHIRYSYTRPTQHLRVKVEHQL